jgi:tellurite resistance-related uncharacterized protein
MERAMVGFRLDEHGDWVALLDCGHPQHVRHTPPFMNRPWVTTEAGRAAKIGQRLDCVRCDRFELPADFTRYGQTETFTEDSIPAGLLKDHTTKAGVWARIVVHDGRLRYDVDRLDAHFELTAHDPPGIVVPEVPHHVAPLGPVRFHVEFYRSPEHDRRGAGGSS